jgi:hypothetical protein
MFGAGVLEELMKISSYGQPSTVDQNYVLIFRVSPSVRETEMLVLKISVP